MLYACLTVLIEYCSTLHTISSEDEMSITDQRRIICLRHSVQLCKWDNIVFITTYTCNDQAFLTRSSIIYLKAASISKILCVISDLELIKKLSFFFNNAIKYFSTECCLVEQRLKKSLLFMYFNLFSIMKGVQCHFVFLVTVRRHKNDI